MRHESIEKLTVSLQASSTPSHQSPTKGSVSNALGWKAYVAYKTKHDRKFFEATAFVPRVLGG